MLRKIHNKVGIFTKIRNIMLAYLLHIWQNQGNEWKGGVKLEKLYTPQEVAEILGFAVKTVQNYISEGKIKSIKVFGSNRVTESEIKRLIGNK